jgi:hypothetical protein
LPALGADPPSGVILADLEAASIFAPLGRIPRACSTRASEAVFRVRASAGSATDCTPIAPRRAIAAYPVLIRATFYQCLKTNLVRLIPG